jgi:hypothetical protein
MGLGERPAAENHGKPALREQQMHAPPPRAGAAGLAAVLESIEVAGLAAALAPACGRALKTLSHGR